MRSVRPSAARLTAATVLAGLALTGCSSKDAPSATPAQLVQAGLAATNHGNDDAAVAAFREAVGKESGNLLAHYNLGVIYQRKGNAAAASTEYAAALMANAKYVPALYNAATILAVSSPAAAMMLYRQVVELDPKNAAAHLNLGLLELQAGERAAAKKDVEMAVVLDSTMVSRVPAELRPKTAQIVNGTPAPVAP